MKVATTSFSLLPSILSNKKVRLIIVTGKGGVGKTSLSLAYTKYLKDIGRKVLYNSFDQAPNSSLVDALAIDSIHMKVEVSAEEYIAKKIGSKKVASWIMKTPFFKSLFNMLPGLGQMILLGNIINMMEEDEELTIVLDSPSSGHALTMLESPKNFKEMFRTGLIVEDINRMQKFLFEDNRTLLFTASLPSQMATVEALELEADLKKRGIPDVQKLLNDSLLKCNELIEAERSSLPEFLKKKLEMEEELSLSDSDWPKVPHFSEDSQIEVIRSIVQHLHAQKDGSK